MQCTGESAGGASSSAVYVGGNFTSIGGIAANNVAKWDGASWGDLGGGVNNLVSAVAILGTDLYTGGTFTNAGGVSTTGIARWDGSSWSDLAGGVNNSIYAVAIFATDLYAGGTFESAGSIAANHIAKWDGSNWFALSSGVNADVLSLGVLGSDLYVGGIFTAAGGNSSIKYIAKWNGTSWSSLGDGVNYDVYALAVLGSDLYVGGYFSSAGGIAANRIAKWDGTNWAALGSGVDNYVRALTVIGTDLYVGGDFTVAGGVAANYIAKWDGTTWSNLDGGVDGGNVFALGAIGTDLYVGGTFTTVGGNTNIKYLARWDGLNWHSVGQASNGVVEAIATIDPAPVLQPPGLLAFTNITSNSVQINWNNIPGEEGYKIERADGSDCSGTPSFSQIATVEANIISYTDSGLSSGNTYCYRLRAYRGATDGPYSNMRSVNVVGTGSAVVYVGGDFTSIGGIAANGIAKWDGASWGTLGDGVSGSAGARVYAIDILGTALYVGGWFESAGGIAANNIAKWNGTSWISLGIGIPYGPLPDSFMVYDIAILGNEIYVGGWFDKAGGISANNVAKWDGSSWHPLGQGVERESSYLFVSTLSILGKDLYVGGDFNTAGGINGINCIARWDGSNWSPVGSGLICVIYTSIVLGTDLYVGGSFSKLGGHIANGIAKWDGSSWKALIVGANDGVNGTVRALTVIGTDLYVGGNFTSAGGIAANRIAKWNGSNWSTLGSGVSGGEVYALASLGSDLYVGGIFTTVGGNTNIRYLARWDGSNWHSVGQVPNGMVRAIATIDPAPVLQPPGLLAFTNITSNSVQINWNNIPGEEGYKIERADNSDCSGTPSFSQIATVAADVTSYTDSGLTSGSTYCYRLRAYRGATDGPYSNMRSVVPSGSAVSGLNGPVRALAISPYINGLYVGGDFTSAGTEEIKYVAFFSPSKLGGVNPPIGPVSVPPPGGGPSVMSLGIYEGDLIGGLYVGGQFDYTSGSSDGFIKYDGTNWVGVGNTFVDRPKDMIIFSPSEIYVGCIGAPCLGSNTYMAKWDGLNWTNFGSGVLTAPVNSILGVKSGLYTHIYIGTTADVLKNFGRWDGVSFSSVKNGTNAAVSALAQYQNYIYLGGVFTTVDNSITAYRIARYDFINNVFGNLEVGGINGVNGEVKAIAVDGSSVYIGGSFTSFVNSSGANVSSALRIAVWYSGFQWQSLGSNDINGDIYDLAIDNYGYLYLAGNFTSCGGKECKYVAKYDGADFNPINTNISTSYLSAPAIVGFSDITSNSITINWTDIYGEDGYQIYKVANSTCSPTPAEASFSYVASVTKNVLFYQESSLAADTYYCYRVRAYRGTNYSPWSNLKSVKTSASGGGGGGSGDIYAGGYFSGYVKKFNGTGWEVVGAGVSNAINTMVIDSGKVYAGGVATCSVTNHCVAIWDGSSWSYEFPLTASSEIFSIIKADDIYVGRYGGVGFYKYDSGSWNSVLGGVDPAMVSALGYVQFNGKNEIWVAGGFSSVGPLGSRIFASRLARYVLDSTPYWAPIVDCPSGYSSPHPLCVNGIKIGDGGAIIRSIAQGSNYIYIGGGFVSLGATPQKCFARVYKNPSSDTLWDNGGISAFNPACSSGGNQIHTIAVADDNDLYIGGNFSSITNSSDGSVVSANNIAHFNGTKWEGLIDTNCGSYGVGEQVNTILIYDSDNIYLGGSFLSSICGQILNYVARYNKTDRKFYPVGSGFNNSVRVLTK